jgi:hypothetical protein
MDKMPYRTPTVGEAIVLVVLGAESRLRRRFLPAGGPQQLLVERENLLSGCRAVEL